MGKFPGRYSSTSISSDVTKPTDRGKKRFRTNAISIAVSVCSNSAKEMAMKIVRFVGRNVCMCMCIPEFFPTGKICWIFREGRKVRIRNVVLSLIFRAGLVANFSYETCTFKFLSIKLIYATIAAFVFFFRMLHEKILFFAFVRRISKI